MNSFPIAFGIYLLYKTRTEGRKWLKRLEIYVRKYRKASMEKSGRGRRRPVKPWEEGKPTMKGNQRTVAFQVPEELFERFKEYLKRNGVKQNAFFLDCIQKALEENQNS